MLTLLRFFIYLFFNEYLSRMEHLILGDPGAVSVRESPWRHCPTRAPSLEIDSQPLGLRGWEYLDREVCREFDQSPVNEHRREGRERR